MRFERGMGKSAMRVLFVALLGLSFATPAFAQATPAPTLNSGDTAWMIVASAFVLMMTIPGAALFYGGMVRAKNLLSVMMQCMAITSLVTVLWMVLRLFAGVQHRRHAGWRDQPAFVHRRLGSRAARRNDADIAVPDGAGKRVRDVSADLRHHHAGADHRRLRRAHEVQRHAVVQRPLAHPRLPADRSHGVERPWLPARRPGRARFRRRYRGAYQCRYRGSRRMPGAGQAPRLIRTRICRRTTSAIP